ncbi:TlyA family rRNA (cytidine-2'-O)-methyltransferase [Candidatus Daviesbacteria bacterium]|nr:TlyA family rRNA (cytidine-2'-O)-methyltransferase [Candidatus Daviesbacteria bacterium]
MASEKFVSRGGVKLQAALGRFQVDVKDQVILDVGSSTGGFVDCLLQNGAKKVYALDTAYGELAWKLRNDPRVVVMERTNILQLDHLPGVKAHLEGENGNTSDGGRLSLRSHDSSEVDSGKVDLVTIDAGWTKLELVLPVVSNFLKPDGIIIALLKPHYEASRRDLIKGVLPVEKAAAVKEEVVDRLQGTGYRVEKVMESPILGGAGNKEYLLHLTFQKKLS